MTTIVEATAARLKAAVGEDNIIDVGKDAAELLGVPKTKLLAAIQYLSHTEGYKTYYMPIYQSGGLKTTVKVLARPGSMFSDIYSRIGEVQPFKPETTRKEIAAVGAASKTINKENN